MLHTEPAFQAASLAAGVTLYMDGLGLSPAPGLDDPVPEGGGVLINQSIHTMDLLVRFLGRPRQVEAPIANHHLKGVIEVEDTMEA